MQLIFIFSVLTVFCIICHLIEVFRNEINWIYFVHVVNGNREIGERNKHLNSMAVVGFFRWVLSLELYFISAHVRKPAYDYGKKLELTHQNSLFEIHFKNRFLSGWIDMDVPLNVVHSAQCTCRCCLSFILTTIPIRLSKYT